MRAVTRVSMLLAVVVCTVPALAQVPDGSISGPLSDLDGYVRHAVRDWEVPGLAIAVVRRDTVVFARGYGVRKLGGVDAVDRHTLFANASTTKAFTAMLIGMLVDEGRLGWDDRVVDHLPEFALEDPYASRAITLRDLLTHHVGFGDPEHLWYGMETDFDEILGRLRHVPPVSSFRSLMAYNNVGYAVAGVIAGKAHGSSWDAAVRQRILDPLGMSETTTRGELLDPGANVALPHDLLPDTLGVLEGELGLVDPIPAAGSIYSSLGDMIRWTRFLLARGMWNGERLVSEASFEELFRPQTVVSLEEFYPTANLTKPWFMGYGLGWFLQDYRGRKVAFHTGSIDGTVAIVGLLPDLELGVVVFANRDHAELRHALMFRVFDAYLGEPRRDWSADLKAMYDSLRAEDERAVARTEADRLAGTRPALPLAAYAGTYSHPGFGPVEVRREQGPGPTEGRLVLRRSPYRTADLEHWHLETFRARWRNPWMKADLVTFEADSTGSVSSLRMWGYELERIPTP